MHTFRLTRSQAAIVVIAILILLVGAVFLFGKSGSRIPVLTYHEIVTTHFPETAYSVEQNLLSQEISYLGTNGYSAISFADAVRLAREKKLPAKPVILSFDDAYASQFKNALPLLVARHFTATFFLPSDWVGNKTSMSWNDVRALASAGMEIGGHTKTHAHILGLPEVKLRDEIIGDKTRIEKEISVPLHVFAYPYGEYNAEIISIVEEAGYSESRTIDSATISAKPGHTLFSSTVMTNSFDAFLKALED